MLSYLPSAIVLGLVAVAAFRRASKTTGGEQNALDDARRAASRVLAITLAVQTVHFGEETVTGLHERLPATAGLEPMDFAFFIGFNIAWILIWLLSVPGIREGHRGAYFAAWFLAMAGVVNGIGHPLLALAAGGYFPGLLTAPFIGVAGVWLYRALGRSAGPPEAVEAAATGTAEAGVGTADTQHKP